MATTSINQVPLAKLCSGIAITTAIYGEYPAEKEKRSES